MGNRGRGGLGRGRGEFSDWRLHPERKGRMQAEVDNDLMDTANSPVKTPDILMKDTDKNTKKRLPFDSEDPAEEETNQIDNLPVKGNAMVADGIIGNGISRTQILRDRRRRDRRSFLV
jgi:hypothetical protein